MKLFCVKLVLLSLVLTSKLSVKGQSHPLEAYADHQASIGNHRIALKEYLRSHYDNEFNSSPVLMEKIADEALMVNEPELALKFLTYGQNISLNEESVYNHLSFRKSQIFTGQQLYKQAIISLYEMSVVPLEDMDKYHFYLAVNQILDASVQDGFDNLYSLSYIIPADSIVLKGLENKFIRSFMDKFTFAEFMSYIIPGSGQMILGNHGDGFNSLALNAGLLFLMFETIERLSFVDGILGTGPWFIRYYTGGINNTRQQEKNKRVKERRLYTSQLLNFLKSQQRKR